MNHGFHTAASDLCEAADTGKMECSELREGGNDPERERFSLMTFPLAGDFIRKTMTIQDSLMLAREAGVPCVDVMNVRKKKIPEYRSAMNNTGIRIKYYISTITFFDRLLKRR